MTTQKPIRDTAAEREMLRDRVRSVPCPPPPKGCGAEAEQPCTRWDWKTGRQVPRKQLECVARVKAALAAQQQPGGA